MVVTFGAQGAAGIWWAEARGAVNIPQCTGQPTAENHLGPRVSGALGNPARGGQAPHAVFSHHIKP